MEMLKFIVLAVLGFAAFFIGFSWLVNTVICAIAAKSSQNLQNKQLKELEKLLPGKNCGECGCESCSAYAAAMFYEGVPTDKCTRGKQTLSAQLQGEISAFMAFLESGDNMEELKKEASRK